MKLTQETDPYRKLASKVILQAIEDLAKAYSMVHRTKSQGKTRSAAEYTIYECESFFRGKDYRLYADAIDFNVDGETIIRKCKVLRMNMVRKTERGLKR